MAVMLRPILVTLGIEMCGRRSAERCVTAIMELSVVRGNWPMPAVRMPIRHSGVVGRRSFGCQGVMWGRKFLVWRVKVRAKMMPSVVVRRAKGIRDDDDC